MAKINIKEKRPKKKSEKIRERRDRALRKNHFDLMKEYVLRDKFFLNDDDEEEAIESDSDTQENSARIDEGNCVRENDSDMHAKSSKNKSEDIFDDKQNNHDDEDDEENDDEEDEDLAGLSPLEDNGEDVGSSEEDEELGRIKNKFTDVNGCQKTFPSEEEDDEADGVHKLNTKTARYEIVVLNQARPSTLIRQPAGFRHRLLRSTALSFRVKEPHNYRHVRKWRNKTQI